MKIAVLLTCFNRKQKTLSCLDALYKAQHAFNACSKDQIELEVFLTDDGCTDGTPEAVTERFSDKSIHILKGSGGLFWAKGMCFAWKEAQKRHDEWDYYLLLNDDTTINANCFNELVNSEDYCLQHYKQYGVISGITCSSSDPTVITYGGDVIPNKINGKSIRLGRSSTPQMVDITNANILIVPPSVVDIIGIFYDGYKHGWADNDYSLLARRNNIPVLITASVCGICDNDHEKLVDVKRKVMSMSLKERKAYYDHPLHSTTDYLIYIRRNMPLRLPLSWLFRTMLTYTPWLYFKINGVRGV